MQTPPDLDSERKELVRQVLELLDRDEDAAWLEFMSSDDYGDQQGRMLSIVFSDICEHRSWRSASIKDLAAIKAVPYPSRFRTLRLQLASVSLTERHKASNRPFMLRRFLSAATSYSTSCSRQSRILSFWRTRR
jgi:hypothetical protein